VPTTQLYPPLSETPSVAGHISGRNSAGGARQGSLALATAPAIFQSGPAFVVLASGGRQASELKVTVIERAVTISCGDERRARPVRRHEVDHDRCWMPLTDRNTRIQVAEPRSQQRLTYIGTGPSRAHSSSPDRFAHSPNSFGVNCWRPGGVSGSAPASLIRLDSRGRPSGRGEAPRNSKCSSSSRRSPVITPDFDRSP
jgi:hypothetical protein